MKTEAGLCHDMIKEEITPSMSFDENADFFRWRKKLKRKFIELNGIDDIEKRKCPLAVETESEEDKGEYRLIRFTVSAERGAAIPCYLLIPAGQTGKYPVAITLQGHSTGFHNSIGEVRFKEDKGYADGRGAFALQAVRRGYAALAIEQRGMGERRPSDPMRNNAQMCAYEALTAFALGRTLIGERVWDISRAIDALSFFPECDTGKIVITGNSGGGTAAFYAGCFDERISLVVPSCSFCSYKSSILSVFHCACNYIPGVLKFFEMQDLAALIAPRKFIAVAGEKDTIFPLKGVKEAFETVRKIYEKAGAPQNCKLVVTPEGHYWCEDLVWGEICAVMNK